MELQEFAEPPRVKKWGEEVITLTPPSKIKIQITGPGAQILLDDAPPTGKVWHVLVRVEASETDE